MGSTPVEQSIMVMALMAAELCTHMVSRLPMMRKVTVVSRLLGSKLWKKSSTAWLWERSMSIPVWRRVPSPRNMKEIPKMKSPTIFRFLE